jgi:hypothetical protein
LTKGDFFDKNDIWFAKIYIAFLLKIGIKPQFVLRRQAEKLFFAERFIIANCLENSMRRGETFLI